MYKIVRIAGLNYHSPKKEFYQKHPWLRDKSYLEEQSTLFKQAYVYANSFSKAMQQLGNESEEIVYDLKPLQIKWAKENGISFSKKNWQEEILLAQIEKLRPDVLFFQDIHALSLERMQEIKRLFPFVKALVIFRGFPGWNDQLFSVLSLADIAFVGSPILKNHCNNKGLDAHLVHHYFDPDILPLTFPDIKF